MAESTVFIYALCDPETSEPRYVGKAKNVRKRFCQHINGRELARSKTRKSAWIRSLLDDGKRPQLVVLEEVDESEWQRVERLHIQYFKEEGARLVNGDDGGCGGNAVSDYSKKVSTARCRSPEQRAAVSRRFSGTQQSEVHRIKKRISKTYGDLMRQGFVDNAARLATSMRQWYADRPHFWPKWWKNVGLEVA